jgi:hypothetical protein
MARVEQSRRGCGTLKKTSDLFFLFQKGLTKGFLRASQIRYF